MIPANCLVKRKQRPVAIKLAKTRLQTMIKVKSRRSVTIFGPGDKRLAHSANEWVSTTEVVDCARTLAAWLVRELGA